MPELPRMLAVFLADGVMHVRRWLTVRRVLHIVTILIILSFISQFLLVADVSLLLGLDWGLMLEISGLMMLVTARLRAMETVRYLRRSLLLAKSRLGAWMRRGARAPRTRSKAPRLPPSPDDDAAAPLWALAA